VNNNRRQEYFPTTIRISPPASHGDTMASVHVTPDTRVRLDRLKSYPEESDDQLITRLIDSYEDGARLTKEEVERIRDILRELKEGRFTPHEQVKEEFGPGREESPAPIGDPQAVKDMEKIFSGTAKKVHDPELNGPDPGDTDPGDLHEIEGFDTKGRSRTPRLDSL
jgi:predicted transcriptional regulator